MKNAIIAAALLVLCAIFAGCSAPDGLVNIRKDYPANEIVTIPGTGTFIMRTPNGEIWYAANSGVGPNSPTVAVKLMEAKR